MSTAVTRLANATRALRRSMDAGNLPVAIVRRQLHRLGLELLRRHPDDAELWRGFENLRSRDFLPPAEAVLPVEIGSEMLEQVWSMSAEDIRTCASSLMRLPDPARELSRSRTVMEVLLRAEGEAERVAILLEAMRPYEKTARWNRWCFTAHLRFGLALDPQDPVLWLEQHMLGQGIEAARSWRLLGNERLREASAHGSTWLSGSCGGYFLSNWSLAVRRRPVLGDELPEVRRLLRRASEQIRSSACDVTFTETALEECERADRTGDYALGSRHLVDALNRLPTSVSLRAVAFERARALMDGPFMSSLEVDFDLAFEEPLVLPSGVQWSPTNPDRQPTDWSEKFARIIATGECQTHEDRYFLEASGAISRAIDAWLELETPEGFVEAARLGVGQEHSIRQRILAACRSFVPSDEVTLTANPHLSPVVQAFVPLLDSHAECRDWCVRLLAAGWSFARSDESVSSGGDTEGPHAPVNRIAAAEDLLAEGLVDGAASIAAALLSKLDDKALKDRFLSLLRGIFRGNDVPLSLREVVGRHLRTDGLFGRDVLLLFQTDARAAHPMLDILYAIGGDRAINDTVRFRCLCAWLAVWRVTGTTPTDALIRPFMREGGELLALAAASLANCPDPLMWAHQFLSDFPPLEHPPSTWARELLR